MSSVNPAALYRMAWSFRDCKAFQAAVELDLYTFLGDRSATLEKVCEGLGLPGRGVADWLDLLTASDLLARDGKGAYSNTPTTKAYLVRGAPGCIAGAIDQANFRIYASFDKLADVLRTGRPHWDTGGEDFFAKLYRDDEELERFVWAMAAGSDSTGRAIAAKLDWSKVNTFADLGTSTGVVPVELCKAHPHLTGVGMDLPKIERFFQQRIDGEGLQERLTFRAGSFLDDPLPQADVLIMGYILHMWSLENKKLLINKAFDALPPGGRLVVYEPFIDNERTNANGLSMSLTMIVETAGGFECTPGEVETWMAEAGFVDAHSEHLLGTRTWVVGTKPVA